MKKKESLNSPKVGIIVLNYQSWEDTIECIESLLRLEYQTYRIVIVDNCSPNNSVEFLVKWVKGEFCHYLPDNNKLRNMTLPPSEYEIRKNWEMLNIEDSKRRRTPHFITLIASSENKGYAAGNNIGINHIISQEDCDYIWILNNDVVVDEKSLSYLVEKGNIEGGNCGLIASKMRYYYNPCVLQGIGGKINKFFMLSKHVGDGQEDLGQYNNYDAVRKIDYPIGASIFLNKHYINDVGLLCEDFFLYFEEIDWIRRSRLMKTMHFEWRSIIFHKEGGIVNKESIGKVKSYIADYYSIRNRIIIARKHFPSMILSVYLGIIISGVIRVLKGNIDRAVMVFKIILKE